MIGVHMLGKKRKIQKAIEIFEMLKRKFLLVLKELTHCFKVKGLPIFIVLFAPSG